VEGIVEEIRPEINDLLSRYDKDVDIVARSVEANVKNTQHQLMERSDVIRDAVSTGKLLLSGGVYSLADGSVSQVK